jgi:ABC-2 type transport system permease protein
MKFMSIASKDLKELLRDRRGLFFILLFPLFFMLIFGFAYGNMGENNEPNSIAVVNYDQGVTMPGGTNINFGDKTTDTLKDVKYPENDTNMFNVTLTSEAEADNLVKQRSVDAEIIIPENFSKSISTLTPSTVIVRGDTGYSGFGITQAMLSSVLGAYQTKLAANLQNNGNAQSQQLIQGKIEGLPGTESFTAFDYLAPGMMVFAILMLATSVATILTREVESGTLRRLKLSKMTSFDFLFGGLLPWSLVAAAQVLILFAVAIGIGFHWQGGIESIILAVIIGIIGGIASISLGMIIASFARSPPQAGQLGTLVAVPLTFMVGAFFQLPQMVIGSFMGQQIQVYDILPWYHVANALRYVLTYTVSWDTIMYQIVWAVVLSAILFVIGVFLFSRNRLRPDNS